MIKKKYIVVLSIILSYISIDAQTPNDFIYMPKNTYCLAANYGHSSWNEYWENDLKRNNLNLGTVSMSQYSLMLAGGITDKLNFIVGLPYISTQTSAGNLLGQSGIQDISGWLKYRFVQSKGLTIEGVVGGSIPLSDYVPDFLPLSIGLRCKTATGRLIATYQHSSGFYATGNFSYIIRSTINIDRESYYANGKVYNSHTVAVPDAIIFKGGLGYYKNGIVGEVFVEKFGCTEGDYIRRNDAPFPTNKMESLSVGINGKYQPHNIGIIASFSRVLDGRNVGESTNFSLGIVFQKAFRKAALN